MSLVLNENSLAVQIVIELITIKNKFVFVFRLMKAINLIQFIRSDKIFIINLYEEKEKLRIRTNLSIKILISYLRSLFYFISLTYIGRNFFQLIFV